MTICGKGLLTTLLEKGYITKEEYDKALPKENGILKYIEDKTFQTNARRNKMEISNELRTNVDYIKDHLMNVGGLLIVNRESGKTLALKELFIENSKVCIWTWSHERARQLRREVIAMEPGVYDRIENISGSRQQFYDCINIIEEYFLFKVYPHKNSFKSAITSMNFPVVVKQLNPLRDSFDNLDMLHPRFKLEFDPENIGKEFQHGKLARRTK